MAQSYTASDIEVLSGLDPVRRRPGMYTDTSRPNHLAHEVVDNSRRRSAVRPRQAHRRHAVQGRLAGSRGRRPRHAGRHPPEGEGQRRRADPHAPARRRKVLGQELQVRRRPARRRRLGGQRAVEESRMLGQARRQGIQHQLQGRQGALEARSRRRRRQEQHRHDGALLARSAVLRDASASRCRSSSTCCAPRPCCARACASRSRSSRPARRTSGSTPAA